MIVADANALILLLVPEGAMPHIERGGERVRHFIDAMAAEKKTLLVPAPALAEFVAGGIDRLPRILGEVAKSRFVEIVPFDGVAAIEAGERIRRRLLSMPAAERGVPNWKHAMKYDAQIAAIAVARSAEAVLTDDPGIAAYLEGTDVKVIALSGLPYPPEDPQGSLPV